VYREILPEHSLMQGSRMDKIKLQNAGMLEGLPVAAGPKPQSKSKRTAEAMLTGALNGC
jgi:hypothetical protein